MKDTKRNLMLIIIVLISVAIVIGTAILINTSEKNRSSNKDNSTSKGTETIVDNFVPGRVEIKVTEISEDCIKGIVVNGGIIFKADEEITVKGINSTSIDENGKNISKDMVIYFSCSENDIEADNVVNISSFSIKQN